MDWIIVTHHAEVLVLSGQQLNEAELGRVGVLVLIHHNITEPFLIILQHLRIVLEQSTVFMSDHQNPEHCSVLTVSDTPGRPLPPSGHDNHRNYLTEIPPA